MMQSGSSRARGPIALVAVLVFVVVFIAAFSSPGLQSLAAALFFGLAVGLPLWLR